VYLNFNSNWAFLQFSTLIQNSKRVTVEDGRLNVLDETVAVDVKYFTADNLLPFFVACILENIPKLRLALENMMSI